MDNCKGRIDDWVAYFDNKMVDTHFHIMGTMSGSPISTSRIVAFDGKYVKTQNSVYELGFPKVNKPSAWNVYIK